jgi:orotate phosphoribosyltransferase
MTEKEKMLLSLLAATSYHYSATPTFRLASGKMSQFYIDCKTTTLTPQGLALIGEVIYERIKNLSVQAIGGLEFGAIPLAISTSLYAFNKGAIIKPFVVRKQPKDRGLKKAIEGELSFGDRVIVVEDVITTGGSSLQAIERLREADVEGKAMYQNLEGKAMYQNVNIDHVLAIIDRGEGGSEAIMNAGLSLEAIFTLNDLHNALPKN